MIVEFDDYLSYLQSIYIAKKASDSHFSYGYLARRIGHKSRTNVYRIFQGERPLNADAALRLSNELGHSFLETDYFLTLVLLEQAKDSNTLDFLIQKKAMLKDMLRNNRTYETHRLNN